MPLLTAFTIYHSGSGNITDGTGQSLWPTLPRDVVEEWSEALGSKLRKFECSGILIGQVGLRCILRWGARGLVDLVVHLGHTIAVVCGLSY